jgi:hypothetical protein
MLLGLAVLGLPGLIDLVPSDFITRTTTITLGSWFFGPFMAFVWGFNIIKTWAKTKVKRADVSIDVKYQKGLIAPSEKAPWKDSIGMHVISWILVAFCVAGAWIFFNGNMTHVPAFLQAVNTGDGQTMVTFLQMPGYQESLRLPLPFVWFFQFMGGAIALLGPLCMVLLTPAVILLTFFQQRKAKKSPQAAAAMFEALQKKRVELIKGIPETEKAIREIEAELRGGRSEVRTPKEESPEQKRQKMEQKLKEMKRQLKEMKRQLPKVETAAAEIKGKVKKLAATEKPAKKPRKGEAGQESKEKKIDTWVKALVEMEKVEAKQNEVLTGEASAATERTAPAQVQPESPADSAPAVPETVVTPSVAPILPPAVAPVAAPEVAATRVTEASALQTANKWIKRGGILLAIAGIVVPVVVWLTWGGMVLVSTLAAWIIPASMLLIIVALVIYFINDHKLNRLEQTNLAVETPALPPTPAEAPAAPEAAATATGASAVPATPPEVPKAPAISVEIIEGVRNILLAMASRIGNRGNRAAFNEEDAKGLEVIRAEVQDPAKLEALNALLRQWSLEITGGEALPEVNERGRLPDGTFPALPDTKFNREIRKKGQPVLFLKAIDRLRTEIQRSEVRSEAYDQDAVDAEMDRRMAQNPPAGYRYNFDGVTERQVGSFRVVGLPGRDAREREITEQGIRPDVYALNVDRPFDPRNNFNLIIQKFPDQFIGDFQFGAEEVGGVTRPLMAAININYAPFLPGEKLVLPYRSENPPQVMTARAMNAAFNFLDANPASSGLWLTFNGIWDSVQQLHLKVIELLRGKALAFDKALAHAQKSASLENGVEVATIRGYAIPAVVFRGSDRAALIREAMAYAKVLEEQNVPSTVMFSQNAKEKTVVIAPRSRERLMKPAQPEQAVRSLFPGGVGSLELLGVINTPYSDVTEKEINDNLAVGAVDHQNPGQFDRLLARYLASRSEVRATPVEIEKGRKYFAGESKTTPLPEGTRPSTDADIRDSAEFSPDESLALGRTGVVSLNNGEGYILDPIAGGSTRMSTKNLPDNIARVLEGHPIQSKAAVPVGDWNGKKVTYLSAFAENLARMFREIEQAAKDTGIPSKVWDNDIGFMSNDEYRPEHDAMLAENENYGLRAGQIRFAHQPLGPIYYARPEKVDALKKGNKFTSEEAYEKAKTPSLAAEQAFKEGRFEDLIIPGAIPGARQAQGHGEFWHSYMIESGELLHMIDSGKKWGFVRNVDNLAAKFDKTWLKLLGYFLTEGLDFLGEGARNFPGQKGGKWYVDQYGNHVIGEDPNANAAGLDITKPARVNNAVAFFTPKFIIHLYKLKTQTDGDFIAELRAATEKSKKGDALALKAIAERGREKFPVIWDEKPLEAVGAIGAKGETNMWMATFLQDPSVKMRAIGVGGPLDFPIEKLIQGQMTPEEENEALTRFRFLATKNWVKTPKDIADVKKETERILGRPITASELAIAAETYEGNMLIYPRLIQYIYTGAILPANILKRAEMRRMPQSADLKGEVRSEVRTATMPTESAVQPAAQKIDVTEAPEVITPEEREAAQAAAIQAAMGEATAPAMAQAPAGLIPATESVRAVQLSQQIPLNAGAGQVETQMTAKILEMLGLRSHDNSDQTILVASYERLGLAGIMQLRRENPEATIVVVANNENRANAEADIMGYERFELAQTDDLALVARKQLRAFKLELQPKEVSKSVVQVMRQVDKEITSDEIKAYGEVAKARGILAFFGFNRPVDFASTRTVFEILRAEIRAAEAVGQSA